MKTHRFSYLLVLVIVVSLFTFGSVRPAAAAGCVIAQGSNLPTELLPVSLVATHTYRLIVTGLTNLDVPFGPSPYGITETILVFILPGDTITIIDTSTDCGAPLPLFNDGRENKNDALQTAAVYCGVPHEGDVRVYALFNNVGSIAFTVTKAELAAGIQKPASAYLIKAAKGAELWRLQDGSLRIKRGTYVFDWPGC